MPIEPVVEQIAWLLLAAVLISMVARRLAIPYAVALVIGGLLIEKSNLVDGPRLDPSVVLFAFLPPLLFDAAFRIDERVLRVVARPVLLLAVPGVLATATLVGVVLWLALDLPIGVGLLFGSIVAATDPIAVIAVMSKLKVAHRLASFRRRRVWSTTGWRSRSTPPSLATPSPVRSTRSRSCASSARRCWAVS